MRKKADIHVSIEHEILDDLNTMSDKMKMARSTLLEGIIVEGIKELERLNYNFTQFINK